MPPAPLAPPTGRIPAHPSDDHVATLRDVATRGNLSRTFRDGSPETRRILRSAAYSVVWPVVFARLTRGVERRRGHAACASSVHRVTDECLDGFHNDVESVIDDLLRHANVPVHSIEAWITPRLKTSTIDGYRRRRGARGALQKPRVPVWLDRALESDPWLLELAVKILIWVGLDVTAGGDLWPMEEWTRCRARHLNDHATMGDGLVSDGLVSHDVETVLAAMRSRERWYADYVERPLGRKRMPVVGAATAEGATELRPFLLTGRDELEDANLSDLAHDAIAAMATRIGRGEEPADVVASVIHTVFSGGAGGHDIDYAPLAAPGHDVHVTALLADEVQMSRIVAAVVRIVDELDDRGVRRPA